MAVICGLIQKDHSINGDTFILWMTIDKFFHSPLALFQIQTSVHQTSERVWMKEIISTSSHYKFFKIKNNYYLVRQLVVVMAAWTAGMSLDRKLATTKNQISLGFKKYFLMYLLENLPMS
jgi:hypothetical protein